MNEDLKLIQSVIKKEIKTWTGYRREIVDDVGEKDFVKEMSLQVLDYIEAGYEENPLQYEKIKITKEVVLECLEDLVYTW